MIELLVIGTSHRTSPPELRDRFALVEADLPSALEELRAAGLGEAMLLATCDRVELVSTASEASRVAERFAALLADRTALPRGLIDSALYRHEGEAALRHLFAVASALDSMVLGEPQVLGQVKAAHRTAAELGLAGRELEAVLAAAFAAARRIRRETRIAERPVSIAAATLELARDIHGDLARTTALLLGGGEMGELIAEHFRNAGLGRLIVCGPPPRAAPLARRFAAHLAALEELDECLAAADIVIAALSSGRAALTVPRVAAALRRRPTRPIFVVDAAIPGDAEPAVNDLDGAFLYDLGDLERVALAGRATREAASQEAWRILEAELAAFTARRAERRAVPAIVALRRHIAALAAEALAAAGGDAEKATRLLGAKLLHAPSEVLRELAASGAREGEAMEGLLRRLFRLDEGEESEE